MPDRLRPEKRHLSVRIWRHLPPNSPAATANAYRARFFTGIYFAACLQVAPIGKQSDKPHFPSKIHSTERLTLFAGFDIFNHMVELDAPHLDTVFHALGDATRRRMLRTLAEGERTVGQLAEPFAISLAAASKHIKALEHAGLIRRDIRGRTHVCRLEPGPLASAQQWLGFYERFWTGRLDALEALLRQADAAQDATPKTPTPKGEKP